MIITLRISLSSSLAFSLSLPKKMAISAKSAALYSLNTKHRSAAAPLTSPSTSLQLPRQLRCVRIGFHGSDPQSRPRTLPLVQAKETFSSFDDVLENSDKPVLVDFYATWCGPCQFMVPILNDVGNAMKDKIQVVKIDTEKYPSIADRYKIQALPTFILFKDGEPCDRFEGALSADNLIKRIEDALKLVQ